MKEAQILIEVILRLEVILRHAELLESTKIEPTELVEAQGQHLDTIVPLELINIIGVLHQELALIEVLEVELEVEARIEVRGAAPEAVNPIEVLHQEVAVIVLQEVEVLVQEVAEAIEVLAVVPEARVEV